MGEIRDLETAEIAVQASLTGHMVFSTLHTNDAPSTITRLARHGRAAVFDHGHAGGRAGPAAGAARSAPTAASRPCPAPKRWPSWTSRPTTWPDKKFYRGRGCQTCNNTGFKGRIGLFELMPMNDQLRELINARRLDRAAPRRGLADRHGPLRDAGLEKVFAGVTTIEEVIRETMSMRRMKLE